MVRNHDRGDKRRGPHRGARHRGAPPLSLDDEDYGGVAARPSSYGLLLPRALSSAVARWSPARILLVGGAAAVLLAPLGDSLLRESALAYLRRSSGADGAQGAALPHVDGDGRCAPRGKQKQAFR